MAQRTVRADERIELVTSIVRLLHRLEWLTFESRNGNKVQRGARFKVFVGRAQFYWSPPKTDDPCDFCSGDFYRLFHFHVHVACH